MARRDADVASTSGGDSIPVLLYHDVASGQVQSTFWRSVVSPGLFDEHLSALESAGYHTAKVSELLEKSSKREFQPSVYLTFDDGYASFSETVMPMLRSYGMTGTVFVPTAFVGGPSAWLSRIGEDHRRLMSWSDLRSVVAAGSEVGAHGNRHVQLDLIRTSDLIAELKTPRELLEQNLQISLSSLAYPFGFHSRRVREGAQRCGYKLAFEVGDNLQGGPIVVDTDAMFRIRRIVVDSNVSGERLLDLVRRGRRTWAVQRARCMVRPGHRIVRRFQGLGRIP